MTRYAAAGTVAQSAGWFDIAQTCGTANPLDEHYQQLAAMGFREWALRVDRHIQTVTTSPLRTA
ncbi:MAG: hypothetical protein ACREU6_01685 [Steroidobacteraceae bacterium]